MSVDRATGSSPISGVRPARYVCPDVPEQLTEQRLVLAAGYSWTPARALMIVGTPIVSRDDFRSMYTESMQTSMRVTPENRDALARIAAAELGGVSLDEALKVVLFEHESRAALARLATDPAAAASYLAEGAKLAEVDTAVEE